VDVRLRRSGRAWRAWRTITFAVGLVLVAAALSPPVEAAATGARGHMTQHLLLGMYAPLVLGAPATLPLAALPVRARPRVAAVLRSRPLHALSHPVTAAVLTVGACTCCT
jgi:putative membrane protein